MPTPNGWALTAMLLVAAPATALQRPVMRSLGGRGRAGGAVNGCVVPESADDAGGFGGIIAPPWWDDFQEP